MEKNKQQSTNKPALTFTNLKSLNQLISGNEINNFASGLKKAKQTLDTYCKNLKEVYAKKKDSVIQEKTVQKQPVEQQKVVAQKEVKTEQVQRPTAEKKPFVNNNSGNAKPNMDKKPFNRNFDKNGDRPQQDKKFNNGDKKPFNKDFKKPQTSQNNQPKQLGPKSTFVPRGEVVSFVPKPDNKREKDKSKRNFDNEKKGLNIKAKIRMGVVDFNDDENEERIGRVRVKNKKQQKPVVVEKTEITNAVITTDNLTIKILSEKIGKPVAEIVKKCMLLGMMLNINSPIDFTTAELVAGEFGITLEKNVGKTAEQTLLETVNAQENTNLKPRPPIVTVMGHVDHGKTSLLDAIKKTNVIQTEAGGITQHIGAYSVNVKDRKITFIDTPGHEAFTAMRARGAQVTDIAVLVVAANDGIMPQTIEAINHIKAAKVPMVVAINKIDVPEANIERIKQQLTEHDVLPEEWGGDTICVPISAKQGINIDKLLEMILLVADVEDLKANYDAPAVGTVLESKVDRGRGIVATIIIKEGTLKIGDYIICGLSSGRVRAMMDYTGKNVVKAEPSMAVSVVGLNQVPDAGESAYVVDEKLAKDILYERLTKVQQEKAKQNNGMSLEDFLQQSADSEMKVLKIIVKADVKGSAEAVKQTLEKIRNDEVKVQCIHSGVGSITESDVVLAKASNALIIGFNIKPEAKAKVLADRNNVEVKLYKIIYEAVDEITNIINGMQAPKYQENVVGHVEIRKIFKVSSLGNIAGSYVLDGVVNRNAKVRLLRNNEEVVATSIESLQMGKDDAKQVKAGFECGIRLKGFNDIKEGDIIEVFEEVQIM
ncbi:MAG: translation initiation factor IF-2 [Eubacteriales bacterium]|nr:translation initiation factor IF-2 [Eubacteriales bacterium]